MVDVTSRDGKTVIKNVPEELLGTPEFTAYAKNLVMTKGAGEHEYEQQAPVQQPTKLPEVQQQATALPEMQQPAEPTQAPKSIMETQRGNTGFNQTQATSLPEIKQEAQTSRLQKAGQDFKGGLDATIRGAVPLLTAEMVSTPLVDTLNNVLGTKFERPADGMRALLEKAGISAPGNKAEQLVETLSTVMISTMIPIAAGMGLQGQLSSANAVKNLAPTASKNIGKTLAANPVRNIAGGATSTAASFGVDQALEDSDMSDTKKTIISAVTGLGVDMLTQGLMGILQKKVPALAKKLVDGIDLTVKEKDVIKTINSRGADPTAIEVQKAADNITNKNRLNQIASKTSGGSDAGQALLDRKNEVKRVVQDVFDEADVPLDREFMSKEATGKKLLKEFTEKRGDEVTALIKNKQDIITKLDGGEAVDTSEVVKYMQELATEYIDDSDLSPLAKKLSNWAEEINNKSFTQLEQKRSLIGSQLSGDAFKDMGSIPAGVKKKVYAGVKQAQLDHIKEYGTAEDLSKWKYSNGKLKLLIDDFQDSSVTKIMDEAYNTPRNATPEVMVNVLKTGEPSTIRKFMSRQTPEGKAVAKEYIIFDVLEGIDSNNMSGVALNKAITKRGEQLGIAIGKENLDALDGARKYFKYTKPSVDFMDNFSGGAQKQSELTKIAGPSMQIRAGLQEVVGPIFDRYAKWSERPAVRDILLKMQRLPAGSPKMAELAKELARVNERTAKYETAKAEYNKNKK